MIKIANIDGEILHIFWTTWVISMKFWGKMWLMTIKVTKSQGFTLSLEDTFFEKPQGCQIDSPSHFRVNYFISTFPTFFHQLMLDLFCLYQLDLYCDSLRLRLTSLLLFSFPSLGNYFSQNYLLSKWKWKY